MKLTLVLVHTVPPLLSVFDRLCAEQIPHVRVLHILDEPLLERIRGQASATADDVARLQSHIQVAGSAGAQAVLVTCSTLSPLVDELEPVTGVPVVKIDERMIARAVRSGSKVAVIATSETTREPTRQMLESEAQRLDKTILVETCLVENALLALVAGDTQGHDRLVLDALQSWTGWADVIVLAQASTARVLFETPTGDFPIPVLSSPHLALAQVAELLVQRC
jgi:aspartate/glutamate racemase